jgi:hypothetical protein
MVTTAPTALLMIRTWHEDGSDHPFRAQIRVATDISSGAASTVNVADPDAVVEIVRAFLGSSVPASTD